MRSLLATQRRRGEVYLWLDAENGYPGHERNELLRSMPLMSRSGPSMRRSSVAERRSRAEPSCRHHPSPLERANLLRLVVLYNHGGVYLDLDTMFLRDLSDLFDQPFLSDDFSYRWGADLPYGNNAVMRFRRGSENALKLMETSMKAGSCNPRVVLEFEGGEEIDLTVLPCAFFDPLWPHPDGKCRPREPALRQIRRLLSQIQLALSPGRTPAHIASSSRAHSPTTGTTTKSASARGLLLGRFDREFEEELRDRRPKAAEVIA